MSTIKYHLLWGRLLRLGWLPHRLGVRQAFELFKELTPKIQKQKQNDENENENEKESNLQKSRDREKS